MASNINLSFVTLDVFTSTRFLGNPLAVVFIPAAQRSLIGQETKQRIAREFNLSETVFLHTLDNEPSTDVTVREIDIFTIEKELPFAGHPTIGSAYLVLHHLGWSHVDTLLTKAGPIVIKTLAQQPGSVQAAIPHAVHIHRHTLGDMVRNGSAEIGVTVMRALSDDGAIRNAELDGPVVSIVRGMTFLLVELPSLGHLAKVSTAKRLNFGKVAGLLDEGEWGSGFVSRYYYVPTTATETDGDGKKTWEMQTRMVELGFEDPATGSAACTLASYLAIKGKTVAGAHLAITQGVEMGRESDIVVDVIAKEKDGEVVIDELFLGGTAGVVMKHQVAVLSRQKHNFFTTVSHKIPANMLCALSGEIPTEPVVSRKTGVVFEKRLILKHIQETGKEPGTDEELDPEDLLDVKTSRVVAPRPPNFTSLPSLLKAFQDEWDSVVLETYNTKQQLARTREELATALYQNDAAIRVIARLTKERDEARDALSKVTVTATAAPAAPAGPGTAQGDPILVDPWIRTRFPNELAEHVDELHYHLTKGRKKRPIPEGWATPEQIATLHLARKTETQDHHSTSLATVDDVRGAGPEYLASGGLDGILGIYDSKFDVESRLHSIDVKSQITALAFSKNDTNKLIVACADGNIQLYYEGQAAHVYKSHIGPVTGIALHPGARFFASVGRDKSFVFYEDTTTKEVMKGYASSELLSCAFHPDGHLFAVGTESGYIVVYETKTGERAAAFKLGSPVQQIAFSENGFWFAAASLSQPTVTIFDLRKEEPLYVVKELETGSARSIAWDYTGQFLATAGPNGVTVQQYSKSAKAWTEPFRSAQPAVGVRWGPNAESLVTLNKEGVLNAYWVNMDDASSNEDQSAMVVDE
ncbi:Diaminopimelate epimerase-like protein [Bombardia bombarda]|uniref:Pre-mRNA-processing factor 19 n=1 Tax=Bombardia bombarda TaxID=252184 RepID=A0AA39U2I1_9PEZI|nr:Diaminopimelate epimerase-like protein [Bombardia bombarda]